MEPTDLFPTHAPKTTHPHVGKRNQEAVDVGIGRNNYGKDHFLNTNFGEAGCWGNPYPKSEYGLTDCLIAFGLRFTDAIATDEETRQQVMELEQQDLGCYCHELGYEDTPPMDGSRDNHYCHGDIIAHWANELNNPTGVGIGVCGSRDIWNAYHSQLRGKASIIKLVSRGIDAADNINEDELDAIVHGANDKSPDAWGSMYADHHDLINHSIWPNHNIFGNEEFLLRNSAIIANLLTYKESHLIAFWDGVSNGTKDTINKARDVGIPVTIVNLEDDQHQWLDENMLDL